MTQDVDLEIKFNHDKEINAGLIKKYYAEYIHNRKHRIYIKREVFYCHCILTFQKICDRQKF